MEVQPKQEPKLAASKKVIRRKKPVKRVKSATQSLEQKATAATQPITSSGTGLMDNGKEGSSFIEPCVRFEGSKHLLEKLVESDNAPTIVSVGCSSIDNKTNSWVSYKITTKGNRVIKFEVGEPNMRLITVDEAKVNFVNTFMDTEH